MSIETGSYEQISANDSTCDSSLESPFKEQFVSPEGTYLLAHSVGPITTSAMHANARYLQQWKMLGGDAWPTWVDTINDFRKQIAVLLNTCSTCVCPQPTVTAGFSQWLTALKNQAKQACIKVVMHEEAFPSLGFAVTGLQTSGFELVTVKGDVNATATWEDAFADELTSVVLFTHVHSNTGTVCDVARLSQLAKQHNLSIGVDIAQSVGIVPIDTTQWSIDAVFGSCVKWLSGGTGAGFMVVPSDISSLQPDHVGWFSHANPFEFDIHHFVPASDALRFLGGTPNVQPYAVAAASINTIRTIGVSVLNAYTKRLQDRFIHSAQLDLPYDVRSLGGTLCLGFNPHKQALLEKLLNDNDIKTDVRHGKMRMSFHAIHSMSEVEEIADLFTEADVFI